MKLISCYIENYGKIKKKEYVFNGGITGFCEENGFGKTTLASFLKAMFYGLEPYRSNTKDFCERQRFYPFEGGSFGGNVTFESGGNVYKIERFFGEKSDTQDTVAVFCNGTRTEELGGDIGKSIFGLDRQSFERTAFITSDDIEISSTTGINAKLNNFLEGADDNTNLDAAVSLLEKKSKLYKKSRKGDDLITKEKSEIEKLDYAITNAKNTAAALVLKGKEFTRLGAEISSLEQRVTDAQTRNGVLKDWEFYDNLLKRVDGAKADEARFAAVFSEGIPEEEELAETENSIRRASSLEAEIKVLETADESEKAAKLKRKFSAYRPEQNEINEVGEKVEEYKAAERKYEDTPALIARTAEESITKPRRYYVIAAVISALVLAAGIGVAFAQIIAGIALIAVGAVGLAGSAFAYFKGGKATRSFTEQVENPEKLKARKAADGLSDAVKAFLLPYGYASGNGIIFDFAQFKEDIAYYENLLAEQEEKRAAVAEKTVQKNNCTRDISEFFAKFGLTGDNYLSNLTRLRSGINSFKARKEEVKKYIAEAEKFKADKKLDVRPEGSIEDIAEINAELGRLRREQSNLHREICDDERTSEQLESLEREKEERTEKLKDYSKKYGLLTATVAMLKQAEQNLKEKYVKPVKDNFIHYSSLIESTLGEKVVMNRDFEISFERGGKERSDRHLSAGQRSICALCFRLALINNMYSGEKPFLILDDPFVSLDAVHLEKVKKIIGGLSDGMQIIYFCCHESRAVN